MVGYVSAPPSCHPGLAPGSRATAPFSPGFSGPRHKAGVTAGETTGDAGVPKSVSRPDRAAGNPRMTTKGGAGRGTAANPLRPAEKPMDGRPGKTGLQPVLAVITPCLRADRNSGYSGRLAK